MQDYGTSGTLAATRQTWRHKAARELLADIIEQHPAGGEEKWRKMFLEEVRNDDEYLEAICDYAFDAALLARSRYGAKQAPTAKQHADAMQERATAAAEHAKAVESVKEQIILLNQEMPNGKRARYCTLDYMYRLGGAYKRIGKEGSRKLVGETFNEEEYRSRLKGLVAA